jgi:site-specific DNA-methyltransferase (adenine-specific)
VWRIPPAFDGFKRSPLPRFTVLKAADHLRLQEFFAALAEQLFRVMVPGAHLFIATNPLVSHFVYQPLIAKGFEKRGEIIRLVQTLRGGDRPKNAEAEYPMVNVMPRSCWEPWGLFRKPCEGRVQDNLQKWKTGGLRRISPEEPFKDVIPSSVARNGERAIAPHPSLKPQNFLRQLCRASLPLGEGTILDPFMGSGSTVAAAIACNLRAIGIEQNAEYFRMATKAVPLLAKHAVEKNHA